MALATLSTRLARLDDVVQERLINWGYAACDAGMRAHVDHGAARAGGLSLSRGRDRRRVSEHDELLRQLPAAPALRLERAVLRRQPGAVDRQPRPRAAPRRRHAAGPRARALARPARRDGVLRRAGGPAHRLHLRPAPRLPRPVRDAAGRAARAQQPHLRARGRAERPALAPVLALVLLQRLLARPQRRPARGRLGDGAAADARRRARRRGLRPARQRREARRGPTSSRTTATRSSTSPAAPTPPTSRPASTPPRPGTTSPTASGSRRS